MNNLLRYILIGGLALGLVACKKEEAAPVVQEAPLVMPTSNSDSEWKPYFIKLTQKNMGEIANTPFVYYLSAEPSPEALEGASTEEEKQAKTQASLEEKYNSILEQAKEQILNGIKKENMVAFGSPNSEKMGNIITEVFKELKPESMKGVRVLFIGKSADNDRVKPLIEQTNADYVFVEMK